MKSHKNLDVWSQSIDLVLVFYEMTNKFPKSELFSLSSQIRRAAVSVPANISEGAARNQPKEFIRFLRISLGSLSELDTLATIAFKLNYLSEGEFDGLQIRFRQLNAQLSGLISSLSRRIITT